MPFPVDGGLYKHRQMLAANNSCFLQDKDRAIKNWISHSWSYTKDKVLGNKRHYHNLLEDMAEMVWEAQDGKPLFQFESSSGLPMSWNRPQNGEEDYIRYEIGHINPKLSGGNSHPNNLTFQSARCNQHIQSSLGLDEVTLYFASIPEVTDRINRVFQLHSSIAWKQKLSKLLG